MGTGVGVRLGQVPAHRFVRNACASGCEIQAHTSGCCASGPTLRGRLIEGQPTLGLRVMYTADKGATVTAEMM